MKLLIVATLFAAGSSFASAQQKRMAMIAKSQLFGVSQNGLDIFKRQTCLACDDGESCCDLPNTCCTAAGQTGCCAATTFCDEDADSAEEACVCLSDCPDDPDESGSASSIAPPSSSAAVVSPSESSSLSSPNFSDISSSTLASASASITDSVSGGGSLSAATRFNHQNQGWLGALCMAVAGGIGVLAVVL